MKYQLILLALTLFVRHAESYHVDAGATPDPNGPGPDGTLGNPFKSLIDLISEIGEGEEDINLMPETSFHLEPGAYRGKHDFSGTLRPMTAQIQF